VSAYCIGMKFVRCSICNQEFKIDNNSLLEQQKIRHQIWHENCKIENRNTVEGKVKWINF
jgi:hypothetical protein